MHCAVLIVEVNFFATAVLWVPTPPTVLRTNTFSSV